MASSADDDTVDGSTVYISDDSSFYGDEETRADLEEQARSFDVSSYWSTHHLRPYTIAAKAQANANHHARPFKSSELYNPYEGQLACRQLSESVSDFLSRLMPSTTLIPDIGDHWIRIANPYTQQRPTSEDWAGFSNAANEILEAFRETRARVEATMPGKAKATIKRKIAPLRKQLETDILTTAKDKGCKTGKWLLFVGLDDVDYAWGRVAKGTAEDDLGVSARVAAKEADGEDESKGGRLICIYTKDFENKEDAKRVLKKMKELGLLRGKYDSERVIYYKCDAFTHLGINSGNEFGIRASLFSSKDILQT